MIKSILLSIRPEHAVSILNGFKTLELRKTLIKCELPIDVYLYCTKAKPYLINKDILNEFYNIRQVYDTNGLYKDEVLNGKVVAKFTIGKKGYAWYIDNLVIFHKPKELKDFKKLTTKTVYSGMDCPPYVDDVLVEITKAPSNWMYVYC